MALYPRELEVSRLVNLSRGFGWEKIKEEVHGQMLQVTLEKKLLEPEEVTETALPS